MERRFSRQRRGDRGFEGFEKPVKIGETYDVEIKETGSKGDGIARVKNFVIFVTNGKKGESCKIKITQVARTFAIAEKVGETEVKEEPTEEKIPEGKPEEKKKPEKKVKKKKKSPKEKVEGEKVEDK